MKLIQRTYQDENDQEAISESYQLEISSDVGAVAGHDSPGMRMINIQLEDIEAEDGVLLMRE